MCYSAQIEHDYRRYLRQFDAGLSIREFVDIFWHRRTEPRIKIPKAMEAAFAHPASDERKIKASIDEFNAAQATKLEQELFKQTKRRADAERSLQSKTTKKAQAPQSGHWVCVFRESRSGPTSG